MSFARVVDEPPHPDLLQAMAVLRRPQRAEELRIAHEVEIPIQLLDVVALRGLRFAHGERLRILPGARQGIAWLTVLEASEDVLSLVSSLGVEHLRRPRLPTAAGGGRIYDVVPDGVTQVELRFGADDRRLVEVTDNVWECDTAADGTRFPDVVRWFGGAGQVLAVAR